MRLHHFEVVGCAAGKSVARLSERLLSEIDVALGYGNLIGGRLQVQQRVADVLLDLRPQVVRLLVAAIEFRLSYLGVAVSSIPGKDGNLSAAEVV